MTTAQTKGWKTNKIIEQLLGKWEFVRSLKNSVTADMIASARGVASFTADENLQAICDEQGIITLASGQTVQGSMRYYFRQQAGDLEIFFDAERTRLFHRLHLQDSNSFCAESTHFCVDDQYHSHYEFNVDGSFTITHTVNGPRKSYISSTRYCRITTNR